ncbi:LacI family DNA-binding transcriptional regulator [Pseudonocardia sp. TRM90224]|uniref:GntR family transcriptional regulator n=1 Tax=Pseudonocardia sp. TRM90224 TaxID=2812678 RepID=UPI001E5D01E2|nr:LacI family DNA-binding transcriptional regulator [Pseudonocardia sp. TRM90224]
MGAPQDRPQPASGVALFAWVKQELLDSIARGEFTAEQPFVTQREIVERYGVSTTTAVRALNELVSDGVVVRRRGRGTFVAERVPQPAAPRTASNGQPVVTYVSADANSPHETSLLNGLAAECALLGYRVGVEYSRGVAHEEEVLRGIHESGASQAVVLFAREGTTSMTAIDELRRAGVAVVLVDRYVPGLPTDAVLFDDFAIGYEITETMIARGHGSPVVLWSESDVTSVRDRLSGHYRALRANGLAELPERSALRGYDSLDPTIRRSRLRSWLEGDPPLTGLICGNAPTLALVVSDMLAMETGFTGSVEFACMDQSLVEVSPLAVASARLPTREMGRQAARLLHERLTGHAGPLRHIVLPVQVDAADRGQNRLGVIGTPS